MSTSSRRAAVLLSALLAACGSGGGGEDDAERLAALFPGSASAWIQALPSYPLVEGLVNATTYGAGWADAAVRANVAAAIKVTRRGPDPPPGRAEIDAFLRG